jgi:Beta-lactamase enzyme family
MSSGRHGSPQDPSEGPPADRPVSRTERRHAKKRHHRRQLIGAVCVLVLVCAAGEGIRLGTANTGRRSTLQANRKGGGTATSTTSSTIVAATQHESPGAGDLFDIPAVAAYMSGTSEDVTAAVYDDITGVTSLYRPGVAQETASIEKVDILATLLAQGQAQGQAISPVDDPLAVNMIEESDNDDAQDLWDSEGGATAVGAFDTAAGLTQTDPDAAGYWGLSTTTAADQVQLVRTVAYPNTVLTSASQAYELGLMEHVDADQAWGVSAGVAAGATVALKNGWLPLDSGGWQVNSVGYIDGAGRDYVIAVLTDDDTEANGIAFIQGLSGLIWQTLAPSTS